MKSGWWPEVILPMLKMLAFCAAIFAATAFGGYLDFKESEARKVECHNKGGKVVLNNRKLVMGCIE